MAADTARVMGSCKFQTFSCRHLLNNKNHKSLEIPSKFQVPKLVSFTNYKPRSDLSEFRCSSSSFSDFSTLELENLLKNTDEVRSMLYKYNPMEVLTVTILVLDEDEKFKRKMEAMSCKKSYDIDPEKKTNVHLNEIVPLLLEDASLWMSSRLMVSSNLKEAFLKMFKSEQMIIDKVISQSDEEHAALVANMPNATRCTEVFMDVCLTGVLENKFKEIYTRDDLKGLLHHLMSMEGVMNASTVCLPALAMREKDKALEGFSHATT